MRESIRHLAGALFALTIALAAQGAAAQGDPYYDDVVLLVHFTGSDGQTSATDESSIGRSVNFEDDAEIQSDRLDLDGSGDYVWAPDSADFTLTGDFTLEYFDVAFRSVASNSMIASHYQQNANDRSWHFGYFTSISAVRFGASFNGSTMTTFDDSITPATDGTAYDWAIERSGSTLRIYRDGVMQAKGTLSGALYNSSARFSIGQRGILGSAADFINGTYSAVRVTNGTARYADDGGYTVPSLPLPDFPALPAGTAGTVNIIVN